MMTANVSIIWIGSKGEKSPLLLESILNLATTNGADEQSTDGSEPAMSCLGAELATQEGAAGTTDQTACKTTVFFAWRGSWAIRPLTML